MIDEDRIPGVPEGGEPGEERRRERHDAQYDAVLLERLRRAGPDSAEGRQAAGELYARHYDSVMAQAYRITGDRHRAEDYAAEAFAKTLRAMKGGRGPRDSFVGYVLIAMRTEAIRGVSHERQTRHMEPEEMDELPQLVGADHAGLASEKDHIVRAFRKLPELQQQALYLLEVKACSIEEAAERLQTNPAALRALSYRARESLRTAYLQQYVEAADPGCAEYAGLLAGYTRKGLGKRQLKRVSEHLATCESCGRQVAVLTQINSRLHAWLGPLLVGGGAGAVLAGAGGADHAFAATSSVAEQTARRAATISQKVWWAGIAAAGLLVLAGLGVVLAPSNGGEVEAGSPAAPVQTPEPEQQPTDRLTPGGPRSEPSAAEAPTAQPEAPRIVRDDRTPFWKLRE